MNVYARAAGIAALRLWVAPINWLESSRRESNQPSRLNERPLEYAYALSRVAELQPRSVLDVGCGNTAWPAILSNCGCTVVATDKGSGYWDLGGTYNRHYPVVRDDILHSQLRCGFDLVTCISTLEHIPQHREAVAAMLSRLRVGGHLVITAPFDERGYIPNVYKLGACDESDLPRFICQVFGPAEVESWLQDQPAVLVDRELYEVFSGEHWSQGERLPTPRRAAPGTRHHLAAMLIRREPARR